MREIETDSEVFISKLDWIMDSVEANVDDGLTVHTLFQRSNNKLKIEIGYDDDDKRKLIYIFYDRDQILFKSMECDMTVNELRSLVETVKKSFGELHLVRNAHITCKEELFYYGDQRN